MERNIDNVKDVMYVVTDMEYPMKTFEEYKMPKYIDEDESKSILKKKRLELALMRYMDIEEKINKR